MKNSIIDGQLSLFDDDLNLLFEDTKPSKKVKKTKSPVSTAQAVIKTVKNKAEDYLEKGNRILTLAKEQFERKFKEKYDFSDFEKKVFTLKYDKPDTVYGLTEITLLKPLAREFRKLLKSIEELTAGDKAYDTLMGLFKDSYEFELSWSELKGYNVDSTDKALTSRVIKLSMRVGEGTLVAHGLQDVSHSKKHRNCVYASKAYSCYHEGCADLAFLLAYMYIATIVSKEIVAARQESTFFYENNAELLNGNIQSWIPGLLKGTPYFRDGVLLPEEKSFVEQMLGKGILTVDKSYRFPLKGEWCVSRGHYAVMRMCYEPHVLFSSDNKVLNPEMIFEVSFEKEMRYRMPSYGEKINILYKLFLGIAEEKGAYIRESEYFKESGHVARAFETKKNIPEKTVKAMEESEFNEYFGYVEFDEDVDLEKVSEIAKEFIAFKETYLPGADVKDNQIRFRKLGKHKALGLYYPSLKCLCVDINAPSSLIHEFGHLLDYKYEELSSKFNFYAIRKRYEKVVDAAMGDDARWNGNTKYNRDYYLRPTEIFARSFEIYMSRFMGLKNSILETPGGYESFCYPSDEEYLQLIKIYFDELLVTINASANAEVA